jgi:HEPN domain-containing protein
MIDIGKQAAHWRDGADEDWDVARDLILRDRVRHGLFFAHLAVEKTLKAHVCLATQELAPPTHNLVRLAQKGVPSLSPQDLELLAEVNSFNIEGRYPELLLPLPTAAEARDYMNRIEELLKCLKSLF